VSARVVVLALSCGLALGALAGLAPGASAQDVRYSRPYEGGHRLNYGFDHNGGGGCTDYACAGACYDGHTGSDFGTPYGTTVLAAADGTVSATNDGCADYGALGNTCGGRCGNHVQIRHDDGSYSIYCHMRRGTIAVGTGARVRCGQVLGQSASSGNSTGPHLHFGHRSPGAGSSSDPFAGGCSRATSLWTGQRAYREAPAPECGCSPSGEVCNGVDDDCDGRTDEDLVRGCGTDVGECTTGTQRCAGGGWGTCEGAILPRDEDCNGRDDDCDGATDEALVRRCGTDVGECVAGTETCQDTRWGACLGAVAPVAETCNALDDDCDGEGDEDWICEREEVALGTPLLEPAGSSDLDGDGRADACGWERTGGGSDRVTASCVLARAHGFARALVGPTATMASVLEAATLRTADLDGDGRADLCARLDGRLACFRSDGRALVERLEGPEWPERALLWLADVDGDGRADACLRDAGGLRCHRGLALGLAEVTVLEALSDAAGFASIVHHGSLRMGDVDGDGRDDACARGPDGLDCWLSEGDRFGARVRGPRWTDPDGWGALSRWSTLRLADVDGDGRADVCGRAPSGFTCAVWSAARGELDAEPRLEVALVGPAMSDADGWDRPERYATIRMGDVDRDGRADLCARAAEGVRCWLADERGFSRAFAGPALSDAAGYGTPARYRTLRLADVDADERADLCWADADGLACARSLGDRLGDVVVAPGVLDVPGTREAGALRLAGGGPPRTRRLVGTCAIAPYGASRWARSPALALAALALAGILARRRRGF
jgi:hypothetical protein